MSEIKSRTEVKGAEVTLSKAMLRHLKPDNESLPQFLAEMKKLTTQDKLELIQQFRSEFHYRFVDANGAPLTTIE